MFPACKANYPSDDANVAVTVVADQLIIQRLNDDGEPSVRKGLGHGARKQPPARDRGSCPALGRAGATSHAPLPAPPQQTLEEDIGVFEWSGINKVGRCGMHAHTPARMHARKPMRHV